MEQVSFEQWQFVWQYPAGMHCPSWDDAFVSSYIFSFCVFRFSCFILQCFQEVFHNIRLFVIDKLQRVMNAAERIVRGTRKYDHGLAQLLHAHLH